MGTLQRAREAWDADNLDAFLAEADPEIEWHTALEQALEGRASTYRGHDGVREAWDEYRGEAWGGFTCQVQEIRDLGESVLSSAISRRAAARPVSSSARNSGSSSPSETGRSSGPQDFLSHADALEAAGLSE